MKNGLYALTVRTSFAAAHRLREYEGNCERLHGHNWQVEVTVESDSLDSRGMAVDFDWRTSSAPRYVEAYRRAVALRSGRDSAT